MTKSNPIHMHAMDFCITDVFSWCEICTWNETYQCWDDEEGDDKKYDSVDLYLEIPEQE